MNLIKIALPFFTTLIILSGCLSSDDGTTSSVEVPPELVGVFHALDTSIFIFPNDSIFYWDVSAMNFVAEYRADGTFSYDRLVQGQPSHTEAKFLSVTTILPNRWSILQEFYFEDTTYQETGVFTLSGDTLTVVTEQPASVSPNGQAFTSYDYSIKQ